MKYIITLALLTSLLCPALVMSAPTISPIHLEGIFIEGEEETYNLTLTNDGEEAIAWQTRLEVTGIPQQYEDNVDWISWEPAEGAVEPGAESEVVIFIYTDDLGGNVEAVLHFLSDDPDNEDIGVDISLEIFTFPDISIEWEEYEGFPDWVNWNRRYRDLFTGEPYQMWITIRNDGADDCRIRSIEIDSDVFATEFNDEIALERGEEYELVVTFRVPED